MTTWEHNTIPSLIKVNHTMITYMASSHSSKKFKYKLQWLDWNTPWWLGIRPSNKCRWIMYNCHHQIYQHERHGYTVREWSKRFQHYFSPHSSSTPPVSEIKDHLIFIHGNLLTKDLWLLKTMNNVIGVLIIISNILPHDYIDFILLKIITIVFNQKGITQEHSDQIIPTRIKIQVKSLNSIHLSSKMTIIHQPRNSTQNLSKCWWLNWIYHQTSWPNFVKKQWINTKILQTSRKTNGKGHRMYSQFFPLFVQHVPETTISSTYNHYYHHNLSSPITTIIKSPTLFPLQITIIQKNL